VAKGHPPSGERSKVRVVMVEFEGPSGDLHQLTQTLANAVRPQPVIMQAPATPALPPAPPQNGAQPDLFQHVDAATAPAVEEQPPAPKPPNGAPRKLRTPNLISDLDFDGGPKSFKAYIDEINPSGHHARYLAITQWFKEYRQVPEIGADHVFTCYRYLNLPVPADMTLAFRQLKAKQWVEAGEARAHYKITHIGLNQLTTP